MLHLWPTAQLLCMHTSTPTNALPTFTHPQYLPTRTLTTTTNKQTNGLCYTSNDTGKALAAFLSCSFCGSAPLAVYVMHLSTLVTEPHCM
ncbi:hypothetical protein COO60DRAFT_1556767 [Scenedesmus sp. NREL 46B-D3]|nr:hypothetical protein COO60DRAFT_1556767 [Scenedesmus sp. NREL 46B-D3]